MLTTIRLHPVLTQYFYHFLIYDRRKAAGLETEGERCVLEMRILFRAAGWEEQAAIRELCHICYGSTAVE